MEDLHAELRAYGEALVEAMVLEEGAAAARQHRTRAADLGLLPADDQEGAGSIPQRIDFLNELHEEASLVVEVVVMAVCGVGGVCGWRTRGNGAGQQPNESHSLSEQE